MSETTTPKTLWELDSTDPDKAEKVRAALREVMDPELGMSVVDLGLIRDVRVNEGALHVRMILTTPFCPYGPALLEMARVKAEEASGLPTTIELGMQPWDPSLMEEGAGAEWGLF